MITLAAYRASTRKAKALPIESLSGPFWDGIERYHSILRIWLEHDKNKSMSNQQPCHGDSYLPPVKTIESMRHKTHLSLGKPCAWFRKPACSFRERERLKLEPK